MPATILDLKRDIGKVLSDSLTRELGVNMDEIIDFDSVVSKVSMSILEVCYLVIAFLLLEKCIEYLFATQKLLHDSGTITSYFAVFRGLVFQTFV